MRRSVLIALFSAAVVSALAWAAVNHTDTHTADLEPALRGAWTWHTSPNTRLGGRAVVIRDGQMIDEASGGVIATLAVLDTRTVRFSTSATGAPPIDLVFTVEHEPTRMDWTAGRDDNPHFVFTR
jgi:hypothetical protein